MPDEEPQEPLATGLFQVIPGGKMPAFEYTPLIRTPEEARRAGIRYLLAQYGMTVSPTLWPEPHSFHPYVVNPPEEDPS